MSDTPAGATDVAAREQAKWDAYYAGLGEAEETPAVRAFGTEFAGVLDELLPAAGPGSRAWRWPARAGWPFP